jgi:HD-GYP domain-containing protein (c-di-GMP phosphodiesterase class II)
MKTHSNIGYRIAKSTLELSHIAQGILSHHEKFDGTGYPGGLKGNEIPCY